MNDSVNKPNHYQLFADGTEALDVIKSTLTIEEFIGYCKGNVLKYRLRAGKKDDLEQDIAKAETYAQVLDVYLRHMSEFEKEAPDHTDDLGEPPIPTLDELAWDELVRHREQAALLEFNPKLWPYQGDTD